MSMEITQAGAAALPQATENGAGADNVSGLVRLAIERGVDVEVLERLVALQERVMERSARAAFFEAKARFQEECPEIRKSKKADIVTKGGARFGYTYAPLEEITRTIRPVLRTHGLSFSWDVGQAGKTLNVVCVLRHVEGHEDRATFPVPVDTGGRMSDAQATGAALTYGKRQSLISVLGLTTADEDTDARREPTRSAERITESQAADLEVLLTEVGASRKKFLTWMGVEAMEEIPAADMARAVRALESKREK